VVEGPEEDGSETKGGAEVTTEELDRLIGLEAAATKGPWLLDHDKPHTVICSDGKQAYFNVQFIAALRNAAPDLIAMARWAEKAKQATAVATEHCLACYGPGGRIANGLDTSIGCSHCKPLREALAAYPTTTSPARAKE
jgi:hypothetical protein